MLLNRTKCHILASIYFEISRLDVSAQKVKFTIKKFSVNEIRSAVSCGLVTFTKEILSGKLQFYAVRFLVSIH